MLRRSATAADRAADRAARKDGLLELNDGLVIVVGLTAEEKHVGAEGVLLRRWSGPAAAGLTGWRAPFIQGKIMSLAHPMRA